MFPIWKFGSRRAEGASGCRGWRRGEAIGCFGLTEPDAGSDPGSMRTSARARRDGDWVLNGAKMWITNGGIADVAVVWARTDDGIRGFVVPTAARPASRPADMHHKLSLRASVTSELILEDVRLPATRDAAGRARPQGSAVMPVRGPLRHRLGRRWARRGRASSRPLDYATTRTQFGRPIGGFQLTQRKLADMLVELEKGRCSPCTSGG